MARRTPRERAREPIDLTALARGLRTRDVELSAFTDEELAALPVPTPAPTLVPDSDWFAGLTEDQRDLAVATAFRSLVARRMVVRSLDEPGPDDAGPGPDDESSALIVIGSKLIVVSNYMKPRLTNND